MKKEFTEEQKRAVAEYYAKNTRPIKRRIRAVCIISVIAAVFLAGALFFVTTSSSLDFSTADLAGFLVASLSCLAPGIFGIVASRSDDSFRRMAGAFRIVLNIAIIANMLCVAAMFRESTLFLMIPVFALFVLITILSLTAIERNRLKGEDEEKKIQ